MAYDEREAQGASGSGGSGEGSRGPRAYWAEGQIPWPEMRRRMREAFREGFSLRVDDRTLGAIDSLVEAGLFSTRAESATWLLQAGVAANGELFDQINTTVAEIRRLREELQRKMNAATGAPSQDGDTTAPQDTQPTQTGEGEPQHW
jgi:hypothetical protein